MATDIVSIGKKVKEMYPQYANIDDAQLGQRFVLKHGDEGIKSLGFDVEDKAKKTYATQLRKEFSTETKNLGFETMRNAWNAVSDPKATDLTVVYSYIKALDPTSVVREGEINLTKAQESVGSNITRVYKRLKSGGTMSPKVRNEMLAEIGRIYNDRATKQQELNSFYSGLASDSGVDPNDVVGKIGEIQKATIPEIKEQKGESKLIPTIGGILGGAGGFMAGGPVGAGLGAAAGYAGGGVVQETAQDLLGRQQEEPLRQVGKTVEGAVGSGLSGLTMGGLAGSLKGGILKKILNPRQTLAEAQNLYAQGKTGVDIKKILQAGENYAKSDPRAIKLLEKFKPAIESATDAPTLIERMKVWGDAYTKANQAKQGATAGLLDTLYKAGKAELGNVAPDAAQMRTLLGKTYSLPREISRKTYQALKFTALGKLLGI